METMSETNVVHFFGTPCSCLLFVAMFDRFRNLSEYDGNHSRCSMSPSVQIKIQYKLTLTGQ